MTAICGVTISVAGVPMFICTLPPHPGAVHANSNGTARQVDVDAWTMRLGEQVGEGQQDQYRRNSR